MTPAAIVQKLWNYCNVLRPTDRFKPFSYEGTA